MSNKCIIISPLLSTPQLQPHQFRVLYHNYNVLIIPSNRMEKWWLRNINPELTLPGTEREKQEGYLSGKQSNHRYKQRM